MTDAVESDPTTLDELLAQLSELTGRTLTASDVSEIVAEKSQRGVNLSFVGKQQARRIARLVRPRVQRWNAGLSVGDHESQSHNLLIEGDNLQALASLYRWRGRVDLIITDPPYNTGNDFRYNDRWDEDPNDPGLGNWVPGALSTDREGPASGSSTSTDMVTAVCRGAAVVDRRLSSSREEVGSQGVPRGATATMEVELSDFELLMETGAIGDWYVVLTAVPS